MSRSRKLEIALSFTKYSVILLCCWPPPRSSTVIQKLIFDLSWWLMFISSLCLLIPLTASIYANRENSTVMTKSSLLEEMENYIKNPGNLDQQILEKYISQCMVLHVGVVLWTYLTSVSFIIGPFIIPQQFPTDAVYPFPTSAAVLLDCLVATLLWFVCARFELLALTIGDYSNYNELKHNVIQYQNLLRYTNDVRNTINLFIFSTILTSVGGVLFSAIQLVGDQPLAIKGQYAVVLVTASVGLFVCSWAADNLVQTEHLVGINAFHSNWFQMDKRSQTCIMHVISQSQRPITIKVNRILPTLSLGFFSQFLSATFRFFASLRVMIN